MNCPHCGMVLGDQATFCPGCHKIAIPTRTPENTGNTEEKPPKKVAQRLYPPPAETAEISPEAPPVSAPAPMESIPPETAVSPPQTPWKRISLVLSGLATLILIFALYVASNTHGMRVELTKAQTERASAQATVESLGKQVAQLEDTLELTRQERDDLKNQATSLQSQVNAMESTVNQSTYDKAAAQRDLETAQQEKDALADQIAALETDLTKAQEQLAAAETERDTLKKEKETLSDTVKANESELSFYDTYVVFVMLSSDTKYYHKYDCPDFTRKNFLAYSTKLADANGYSPCPKCCG